MKSKFRSSEIRRQVARANALGYRVEFVEVCSNAPHILPPVGACDREKKLIQISRFVVEKFIPPAQQRAAVAAAIAHEIEHAQGADVASDHPELGLRCGRRVSAFVTEHERRGADAQQASSESAGSPRPDDSPSGG